MVRKTPIAPLANSSNGKNKLLIVVFSSSQSVVNGIVVVNVTSIFHVVNVA